MTRTRLGKVVGSYRPPLQAWTYWQEGSVWYVVAPSGARITSHATETDARAEAAQRNREENR